MSIIGRIQWQLCVLLFTDAEAPRFQVLNDCSPPVAENTFETMLINPITWRNRQRCRWKCDERFKRSRLLSFNYVRRLACSTIFLWIYWTTTSIIIGAVLLIKRSLSAFILRRGESIIIYQFHDLGRKTTHT